MPKPKEDSPRRTQLDEVVRGARLAAALKAALELELFTRIAEGNHSLPALLRAGGYSERGVRILLDALVSANILNKSAFDYSLTPTAETFLVKGKPSYYGDALLAQLAWDARGQVARSVKSGKPLGALAPEGSSRLLSARAARTWVNWQAEAAEFEAVWEQAGVTGQAPLRVLGIGAESGVRLLPLIERDPGNHAFVVDNAPALTPLRSILESLPAAGQYELMEGDPLQVSLPAEMQVALVDSISPFRSIEQNIGILHRVYESLVMGGTIVLRARVAEDDRRGPGNVPLFGLDILISSVDGDIYTATEYRGMLEAASFFHIEQLGDKPGVIVALRTPPPPPPPPSPTVAPDFIPPPETRP